MVGGWAIPTDAGEAAPAFVDALIWGVALGAAAGAVLGDALDGVGAGLGALIGVALYAPAEVATHISRGAAEVKPLWHRILSSALLMGAGRVAAGPDLRSPPACAHRDHQRCAPWAVGFGARRRPSSGSLSAWLWALCSKRWMPVSNRRWEQRRKRSSAA